MASLISRGGYSRISFRGPDGKRKTLTLGRLSTRHAERAKAHVEELLSAIRLGEKPGDATRAWLKALDRTMSDRLAAVGLATSQQAARLSAYVAEYIDQRTDAKLNTKKKFRTTQLLLIDYFGDDRKLESITRGDVDAWRRAIGEGRAENTIRKYVGVAKLFFNAALRSKLIEENPFDDQPSSTMPNTTREYFVSRAEAAKVITACPDVEWRLLFALSRYGGLRCPSEQFALKWSDVDWAGHRFCVRSSKTEHLAHGGVRFVPIFEELKPFLEEAFDLAADGEQFVVARHRHESCNLRTQLGRIVTRAGVTPWPKLWQNLRATRQTELEAEFPLHVVCRWLGNSPGVARKHYLQVTDEHFAKAAGVDGAPVGGETRETEHPSRALRAHSNAAMHEMGSNAGNGSSPDEAISGDCAASPPVAKVKIAEAGLEPARPLPGTGF
jgi:hypothetical protein